jgi:hypothetical protein
MDRKEFRRMRRCFFFSNVCRLDLPVAHYDYVNVEQRSKTEAGKEQENGQRKGLEAWKIGRAAYSLKSKDLKGVIVQKKQSGVRIAHNGAEDQAADPPASWSRAKQMSHCG